jgi:hypothetical protein
MMKRTYVDETGTAHAPVHADLNGNPVYKLDRPVPPISCVMPTPCGQCHYCRVAKFGPEYWLIEDVIPAVRVS